jgi:DNA polymerase elongation subunit (family B)
MIHIENFQPYFYLECKEGYTRTDFEKNKQKMMKLIFYQNDDIQIYSDENKSTYTKSPKDLILVWKENLLYYKGKGKGSKYFIKVLCDSPNNFYIFRKNCKENFDKLVDFKILPNMYENGIPFPLRFMIDHHLSGMSWMSLSSEKYHVLSLNAKDSISNCQKEVIIDYANLIPRSFDDPRFSSIASLRVLSFDIECYSQRGFPNAENNPVITIGICCTEHDKDDEITKIVLQLGTCEAIPDCHLFTFKDERMLLSAFTEILSIYDPDILTGYNIQNFDLDYVLGRMKALKMEAPNWGRRANIPTISKEAKIMAKSMGFRETKEINIKGRIQMDMMMHMLKEKKFSSYSLNNVCFLLLGEQKEDVPYNMISVLQDGNENDRKRLASYCLKDSWLPIRLMNNLKCIYNNVEMARVTGVPINYLFSRGQQIKVVSQIHNATKKKNLLVPGKVTYMMMMKSGKDMDFGSEGKSSKGFQGAYVLEPKPGFYTDPIATLDFASLYPSIMIRHNLCYSTFLSRDGMKIINEDDYEQTPEGSKFIKSSVKKGVLPEILENLLSARKGVKKEMKQKKKELQVIKKQLEEIEEIESKQEAFLTDNNPKISKRKLSNNEASIVEENGINSKSNYLLQMIYTNSHSNSKQTPKYEILREEANKENEHVQANEPELFEELTNEEYQGLLMRKSKLLQKKKVLENTIAVMDGRQLALKISANSVYGFTGAQRGHMPCLEIAGSVTAFGRSMIDHTRSKVMEYYSRDKGYDFDADVIYGDTDSVMIKFGSNNLEECMRLGKEAAKKLTQEFKDPIKLEFEKVYYPYLLLSKKRYAGNFWTRPEKPDKKDCKGLESVRRDNCLLVRTMVGKVIDILLNEMDVSKAKNYVKNRIYDLQNGNIDLSKLIISKSLSKNLDVEKLNRELEQMNLGSQISTSSKSHNKSKGNVYTNNSPHVCLAERLYKRNPHNPPMVGDRIPYVILKGPKKSKLYQNSEDPLYALEKDLPIDIDYYVGKQVKPPMKRIFDVVDKQHDIFTGKAGDND